MQSNNHDTERSQLTLSQSDVRTSTLVGDPNSVTTPQTTTEELDFEIMEKQSPREVNKGALHKWVLVDLPPTTCAFCNRLILGLVKQGFQCEGNTHIFRGFNVDLKVCNYPIHKKCLGSIGLSTLPCENKRGSWKRSNSFHSSTSATSLQETVPIKEHAFVLTHFTIPTFCSFCKVCNIDEPAKTPLHPAGIYLGSGKGKIST